MPRHAFLLAVPIVMAAALAAAGSPDLEAERAALFRLDKAWAQAAAVKDLEKTLSFWADDARVFPPGQPAVVGKEALRGYVSGGFAMPGFSIQWETSDFVVSASGDVAYGVGTNTVTVNGPEGKPLTERGRGVTVWRKNAGGEWKCVIDIWNAEPAASPALVPK
jgi:ketosteroid isomerase-like protein